MKRQDHSNKNALRQLYQRKYELDKDFSFKVPRLKTDLHAYLHRLLNAVEEAFTTSNDVVKYKGHELRFIQDRYNKDEDDDA